MTAKRTIVVMPGDGIGRIVISEALRVLDAVGFAAEFVEAEIGWSCWVRDGDPLPERTVTLLAEHRLGLLGAITSKSAREAEADLSQNLRGGGLEYRSPLLTLRQRFDLSVCFRPSRSWPGNPGNFVRRSGGRFEEPAIDLAVFRQNTEGLYAGVEWSDPPPAVREALGAHARFGPFRDVPGADLAIAVRVVTRRACRRTLEAAFRHAQERELPSVTLAEKPNVLRDTSGLWRDVARDVAREYPGVSLDETAIDALLLDLVRKPERFQVIVTSNLLGDIVSDAAAGLTGGIGLAPSANLGSDVAIFEPVHGSAPKHEGIDPPIVNPIGAILAGALLLDHVGETARAARVRSAVAGAISEGKVRTYDMLRLPASVAALARGAATTAEMTDAVLLHLSRS